jgi:putative hydrolase of the HAD superfamily
VDAAVSSGAHGKTKPHPAIFLAALEQLGVTAEEAAMVGDSPEDDVDGAKALGMRAFLIDRDDRFPEVEERLPDLLALPAALGLSGTPADRGD